jgi:hypothetical protein
MPRSLWQWVEMMALSMPSTWSQRYLIFAPYSCGQAIARGVGDVDHCGTGLDDGLDDAGEIFVVRTSCILA